MDYWRKVTKGLKSLPDPMFRRALRFGIAPSHEHRAMLQGLGLLNTIIDVGANVGQFALLALRVQPNAHIYSFEPLPNAADRFDAVIAGDPRVTLHRVALGAQEATLPIHVTSRADSSSLLIPALQSIIYPGTHQVMTQDVRVLPLDSILSKDDLVGSALLKIDVQGYEQQVLAGCENNLQSFDWIFVELSFVELYSGQALAPAVQIWLAERGFNLAGVYADKSSYIDGRMIQADFLFRKVSHG